MCTVLLPPGVSQIAVNKYIMKHSERLGGGPFSRVNQMASEVKYTSISSADVTNEWGYKSTSHVRLHGIERENFTLYS